MKYAVLPYPHQNKRYFDSVKKLCENEFKIVSQHIEGVEDIQYETIGGVELLTFSAGNLSDRDIKKINIISTNFIFFKVINQMLQPVNENRKTYFKNDISGILKYKGKTNEIFTDMMINAGIFSGDFHESFDTPLKILDPVCGKCTTLFSGLIKGYNVSGIEIDKNDVKEANVFLKKYLEYHKYKHSTSHETITESGKKTGEKFFYETADTAVNYKNKDIRTICIVHGNTLKSDMYFKAKSFHSIIADLPYGVQHSGMDDKSYGSVIDILQKSVPLWNKLLIKGGTLVLAFNTFSQKKEDIAKVLSDSGLDVLSGGIYDNFEHWVEQAVNRDIIIGKK